MIQEKILPEQKLKTPRGSEFTLEDVTENHLILIVGSKRNTIYLDLGCIEELVEEFNSQPEDYEMKIGAVHDKPSLGSLDEIAQKYTSGVSAASYLAGILEYIDVFRIIRSRPHRITIK